MSAQQQTSIDLSIVPNNVPSLCIPRVYANITERRIREIFGELFLGEISRIDMIRKKSDKGENFNRVFIHFTTWFGSENADYARKRLLSGNEIKVVYDNPWFWKISAYREPKMTRPIAPKIESVVKAPGAPMLIMEDITQDTTAERIEKFQLAPTLDSTNPLAPRANKSVNDHRKKDKIRVFDQRKKIDNKQAENEEKMISEERDGYHKEENDEYALRITVEENDEHLVVDYNVSSVPPKSKSAENLRRKIKK